MEKTIRGVCAFEIDINPSCVPAYKRQRQKYPQRQRRGFVQPKGAIQRGKRQIRADFFIDNTGAKKKLTHYSILDIASFMLSVLIP